jgi:hypothetical protein
MLEQVEPKNDFRSDDEPNELAKRDWSKTLFSKYVVLLALLVLLVIAGSVGFVWFILDQIREGFLSEQS